MDEDIKFKIIKALDTINDEKEDVAFYASVKDIINDLSASKLKDLDDAINQADSKNVIHWDAFKDELNK